MPGMLQVTVKLPCRLTHEGQSTYTPRKAPESVKSYTNALLEAFASPEVGPATLHMRHNVAHMPSAFCL